MGISIPSSIPEEIQFYTCYDMKQTTLSPLWMITAYQIAIKVSFTNQLTSSYLCYLYKTCQGLTSNNLLCVLDHVHHCVSYIHQCMSFIHSIHTCDFPLLISSTIDNAMFFTSDGQNAVHFRNVCTFLKCTVCTGSHRILHSLHHQTPNQMLEEEGKNLW